MIERITNNKLNMLLESLNDINKDVQFEFYSDGVGKKLVYADTNNDVLNTGRTTNRDLWNNIQSLKCGMWIGMETINK